MNTSEKRLKISHNTSGEGKNVSKTSEKNKITFKDTRKRKQNIKKEQNCSEKNKITFKDIKTSRICSENNKKNKKTSSCVFFCEPFQKLIIN